MRALGGGEGGVVDFCRIQSAGQGLDFGQAIDSWTSRTGGRYVGQSALMKIRPDVQTHLSPVNTSLPSHEVGYSPQTDIDDFITNLRASVLKRVENIPAQTTQSVLTQLQK